MTARLLPAFLVLILVVAGILFWRTLNEEESDQFEGDTSFAAGTETDQAPRRERRTTEVLTPNPESEDEAARAPAPEGSAAPQVDDKDYRDRDPWFEFRLVSEKGSPLFNYSFWGHLRFRDEKTGVSVCTDIIGSALRSGTMTDPRGIGRALVDEGRHPRELEEIFIEGRMNGSPQVMTGRLLTNVSEERGRIRLGDIVLGPRALVASGRVIDSDGKPVVGLPLGVMRPRENAPAGFRAGSGHQNPFVGWSSVDSQHLEGSATDDEGRFLIRGEIESPRRDPREPSTFDGRLRLITQEGLVKLAHLDFRQGAENLEIVVERRGRLSAKFLLPDDPAPQALRWILLRQDRDGDQRSQLPDDGILDEIPVDPGVYELQLATRFGEPVYRQAGLVIESGRHHDLGEIRTEGLHTYVIRAQSAEGEDLKSFRLQVGPPPTNRSRRGPAAFAQDGVATFTTTREQLDVTLSAKGFAANTFRIAPGRRLLVLPAQPMVTVQLLDLPTLEKGESLVADLVSVAAPANGSMIYLDANGVGRGPVSQAGVWRVNFRLRRGKRVAPIPSPTLIDEVPEEGGTLSGPCDLTALAEARATIAAFR